MIETTKTLYSRELTTDFSVFEQYITLEDEVTMLEKKRHLERIKLERRAGKDRIGLVVGRFQPPHAGHMYLIEAALEVADFAVIGIGSVNKRDEDNPYTALLRELIMRRELRKTGLEKKVKFVYLNDYNNDSLWCDKTLEQAQLWGKIDVIVGNNGLVNNIFRDRKYRALEIPELQKSDFEGRIEGKKVRADMRSKGYLKQFGTV